MKKFDPEKELNMVRNNRNLTTSKFNSAFIPLLVVGCSILALIGVTFSYKLVAEDTESYVVKVDIINGDVDQYMKKVPKGAFKDKITSSASFGSLKCLEGNLTYDPITETISSPYINHNTTCILSFRDDGIKKISFNELSTVNDNVGTSYYYKADAKNNFIVVNGMMFRIVRVNGDESLRIITNEAILNSTYSGYTFEESNAYIAINDWFNRVFSNKSYVIDADYDVTNYVDVNIENLVSLDGYNVAKVGLLSVREAALITNGVAENNYIDSEHGIYLANPNGTNSVYGFARGSIVSVHPDASLGLRPVINIKGTLIGSGTINDPYKLEEEQ